MKYIVPLLLLLASPAQAITWEDGWVDDMECTTTVDGWLVVFTYSTEHPYQLPPDTSIIWKCLPRDTDGIQKFYDTQRSLLSKKWDGVSE